MKYIYMLTFCLMLLFGTYGCKEDLGITNPQVKDKVAPGKLTDIKIENREGQAKLVYKIPDDNDLLYVKAVYEIRPGVTRVVKSSKTNDSLIVEGFGDAKEYEIKLYAVDNGENVSEPVAIKVNPLIPPIKSVLNNLNVINDFGGLGLLYNNPLNAELAYVVIEKDESGKEHQVSAFYSKSTEGSFNVRGYLPKPVVFGIYLKDKFGNVSETIYKNIIPLEEVKLDRLNFKKYQLPNDIKELSAAWDTPKMWDNNLGTGFHSNDAVTNVMPIWVSMDMGSTARLSRFKLYQRTSNNSFIFNHNNLKRFEIWGSNDPSPDGSWDSWTLMGSYESKKPSGLPVGTLTNEDIAYAKAGEEYNIPSSAPAVKYIRIKVLENWSGGGIMQIMELELWGKVQ